MNTIALPASAEAPRTRTRGARAWLIASQALMVLALLPWFVASLLSLVKLDSGAGSPWRWLFAVPVWIYPAAALALSIAAWRSYRRGHARRAMVLTTLPAIPALLLFYYLVWAAWPVG